MAAGPGAGGRPALAVKAFSDDDGCTDRFVRELATVAAGAELRRGLGTDEGLSGLPGERVPDP